MSEPAGHTLCGGGTPAVSVLMTVFNAARYLDQAVESILAQSLGDFEFLILDDGSTDGSTQLLRRYAVRDARVQLIERPHRGLCQSRNELLQRARCELVAWMDADDVALPERLALEVRYLAQHPQVVCVGGAFQNVDSAGRYLTTLTPPTTDADIQAALLGGHCTVCQPTAMMRRAAVLAAGGYRGDYEQAEDFELWLRLGECGELANIEQPVLRYRLHDRSVSATGGAGQRAAARRACEEAWRRRGISDGQYSAGQAWRPGSDRASRHAFMLRYGWWAWGSGERATARLYGCKAIGLRPFSPDGWRLLGVSLLKRACSRVPA